LPLVEDAEDGCRQGEGGVARGKNMGHSVSLWAAPRAHKPSTGSQVYSAFGLMTGTVV
jgi:hypothetical protein